MSKGTDLLLINVGGSKREIYQDLSKDFSAIEPPFWAALTAGFIRERGYNTSLIDANAENLSFEETVEKIEEYNPSLTNIVVYGQHPSASTQLMTNVAKLSNAIKEKNLERKIILTGLHPSALPERTIAEEKVDYVCQGEGFYTLLGILEKYKLSDIPGLWWREENNILHNPRAKNVQNLSEELKNIAWDLIPSLKKYKAHNWQCLDNLNERENYSSISTSLGCPYSCSFCAISATFGEHKTRYWTPEWVLNQIEILVEEKGMKNLKFIDEEFTLNPSHFMPIVEGLIDRNYNINIWAYTRVNNIPSGEQLKLMKKAGINWLSPGIESGNEEVRKENSKGQYKNREIFEGIRRIQNSGINVMGNYVFGIEGETKESMRATADLAKELNCEFANFYCATAWPGSQLYNSALKENLPLPKQWKDYAQHSSDFLPLPTKDLSSEEILLFRDKTFYDYFTSSKYLNMITNKFGIEALEHIQKMTQIKLKRNLLR
jgi:radical SAM superfamily enzyme YgiQ (UPF0313 family)